MLDDPDVVAELRDRGIAIEACPSSNVALVPAAGLGSQVAYRGPCPTFVTVKL